MFENKLKAIIGAGHLGSALVHGLIKNSHPAYSFIVSTRNSSKAIRLVHELELLSAPTNTKAVENADLIILAVKPQMMQEVCQEIAPIIEQKKPLIISLAGIITLNQIEEWLVRKDLAITRVMTNTPIEFCKGTSALFANASTSPELKDLIQKLFNHLGYSFWADHESIIDTMTAPIGCAPAYVFLFLEALQKATMSRGIPEELAKTIALEAVVGASTLAKKSGLSFSQLREGVTTPNGVTDYSLQKLSSEDFFHLFREIYAAAEECIFKFKNS